jgi:hypothetical protein
MTCLGISIAIWYWNVTQQAAALLQVGEHCIDITHTGRVSLPKALAENNVRPGKKYNICCKYTCIPERLDIIF